MLGFSAGRFTVTVWNKTAYTSRDAVELVVGELHAGVHIRPDEFCYECIVPIDT